MKMNAFCHLLIQAIKLDSLCACRQIGHCGGFKVPGGGAERCDKGPRHLRLRFRDFREPHPSHAKGETRRRSVNMLTSGLSLSKQISHVTLTPPDTPFRTAAKGKLHLCEAMSLPKVPHQWIVELSVAAAAVFSLFAGCQATLSP